MSWWRRNPVPDQGESQKQAERAIEVSLLQQEAIDELAPQIERKMGILARLNRENNFALRLEQAYHGE